MNSGQTEAKLLDSSDQSKPQDVKTDLVALPQAESSEKVEDIYLSKEELQKILADVNADYVSEDLSDSKHQVIVEHLHECHRLNGLLQFLIIFSVAD